MTFTALNQTCWSSSQSSHFFIFKVVRQVVGKRDLLFIGICFCAMVAVAGSLLDHGPLQHSATRTASNKPSILNFHETVKQINEAFAGQAVACMKELGISHDIVNINGGAVGLGHPLAATGSRLTLTLAHTLKREGKKFGIATACIGGGQGIAIILESL